MAPPLIQLSDIALTFGGTPLLEGAELAVSAGERVCLVGRNGSGKSTLLKIAAGLIEPDRGETLHAAGRLRCATCRRSRTSPATPRRWPMWRPASAPPTIRTRRAICCSSSGSTGEEDPAPLSGGELRRAALAHVLAPAPDILLLDEPTNHLDLPAIEWLEARLAGQRVGPRPDQPRPPLPGEPVADHGVARPRQDAAHRHRLSRLRGLARRAAGRGGAGAAQARPQDRARGALGALRRHRPAQAQRAPHGASCRRCAQTRRDVSRRRRHGGDRGQRGGRCRARW